MFEAVAWVSGYGVCDIEEVAGWGDEEEVIDNG